MARRRARRWLTLVILALAPSLARAGEPPQVDDREIPPDRGRLYIKDPEVYRELQNKLLNASTPLAKRVEAIGIFAMTREKNAVPDLVKIAMNEREPIDLRVAALWGLGEIGAQRAATGGPKRIISDPRGMPAFQYALVQILKNDPAWRYDKGIDMEVEDQVKNVPLKEMVVAQLALLAEPVVGKLAEFLMAPLASGVSEPEPVKEDPQTGRRRAALVTLIAVGDRDPRAILAVIAVLTADDKVYPWDFKVMAAQGLASLAEQRQEQIKAVKAADNLADVIAKTFTQACIVTDVPEVREIAGWALEKMGRSDRAARELVAILEVPALPKPVLFRSIEALAFVRAKDKKVVSQVGDELIFMLSHEDRNVRWRAAVSLGACGDVRAVGFLRRLLKDRDAFVRTKTIAALGHLEAREALPDLVVAMDDPEFHVRRQAALALGRLGPYAAVPVLADRGLKDSHPSVRQAAIIALGYIGRAGGLKHVAQMVADPDPVVRLTTVDVLSRFLNPGATAALVTALGDADKDVRAAAMAAVQPRLDSKPKDTIDLLVAMAANPKSPGRAGALACLADDYQKAQTLKDPSRKALYDGLLKDADSPLAVALIQAIKDPQNADLRRSAASLLLAHGWSHKNREFVALVAGLADDMDDGVRNVAKTAQNFLRNLPR